MDSNGKAVAIHRRHSEMRQAIFRDGVERSPSAPALSGILGVLNCAIHCHKQPFKRGMAREYCGRMANLPPAGEYESQDDTTRGRVIRRRPADARNTSGASRDRCHMQTTPTYNQLVVTATMNARMDSGVDATPV